VRIADAKAGTWMTLLNDADRELLFFLDDRDARIQPESPNR